MNTEDRKDQFLFQHISVAIQRSTPDFNFLHRFFPSSGIYLPRPENKNNQQVTFMRDYNSAGHAWELSRGFGNLRIGLEFGKFVKQTNLLSIKGVCDICSAFISEVKTTTLMMLILYTGAMLTF